MLITCGRSRVAAGSTNRTSSQPAGAVTQQGDRLLTEWYPDRVAHAVACSPVVAAEWDRLVLAQQAQLGREAVQRALADEGSWADIGDAAGISRQSAHERWSKA